MFIRIESSSGMPITRQIAEQIRTHCAVGRLAPGDRLPSVRQLAQELAVNQNTILRVYERLTGEGLLERRHGDGTYVALDRPAGQLEAQRRLLRQDLERLARKAVALGMDGPWLHKSLDEVIGRVGRSTEQAAGAERRER
jgi:GntR family transcriptional regulator